MIRVIATLLWNGQTLVKGVGFDAWRSVGHPLQAINVFQMREVDEILFLDITATKEGRRPNFGLVEQLAEKCFVPLTVGGGVKSVEDVRDLLRAGADKVSIRTALDVWKGDGGLPGRIAETFGAQVLIGCVDYDWASTASALGAHAWVAGTIGELMVQSVKRDGTMRGYDVDALKFWSGIHPELAHLPPHPADCPIIASGGAGTYGHFAQAIDAGASAVAAGAMWLFTEQTPLEAKKYLKARGYDVRL